MLNFKYGLAVLSAAIMAKKGATATTLLKRIYNEADNPLTNPPSHLGMYVDGNKADCEAVAAAMNNLCSFTRKQSQEGSGAICGNADADTYPTAPQNRLYINGSKYDCNNYVNYLKYAIEFGNQADKWWKLQCGNAGDGVSLNGADFGIRLQSIHPLTAIHLNDMVYSQVNSPGAIAATDLADMKADTATNFADMKVQLASSVADTATNFDDMKAQLASSVAQLAELKALLTPECVANRLARAQDTPAEPANPAADPANPATIPAHDPEGTSIVAIVVPIVAVLLLAAILIAVVVKRREATAAPLPASAQPNPAFNLANSLATIEAP